MIYLDTHVAAWLYAGAEERMSTEARSSLRDSHDLRVSPMVRLELQYLFEIGRVTVPAAKVMDDLRTALGLAVCDASFVAVAHLAEDLQWTRDPFDRLIVAQAALHEAHLITKDATLHRNYPGCIW